MTSDPDDSGDPDGGPAPDACPETGRERGRGRGPRAGAGPDAGTDRLAQAERDFLDAAKCYAQIREELSDLLTEVRDGKTARAKRLRPIASELARAVGTLVREKERLDAVRDGEASEGRVSELDLEAARDEVDRRLARLRAAGPEDGVS